MTDIAPVPNVTRLTAFAPLLLALCACATTPTGTVALQVGEEASLEGKVVHVDTAPWAYDGNAVVTVSTSTDNIGVHLPARWNLCKAPPPDDVQALKAGDRVRVTGTVSAAAEVVVCAQPQHRLSKLG